MNTYGYVRVSTHRQEPQRQINNILRLYPDAVIYTDKYTGTSLNRPEFQKMIKQIEIDSRNGEQVTIIFDEVSRMSRNAEEGFKLYQEFFNKKINLVFLKEPHISTQTYRKALTGSVAMTGTKTDIILKAVNEFLFAIAEEQIQIAFIKAQEEVDKLHIRTAEGMKASGAINAVDERGNKIVGTGKIAISKTGKHPVHKKSVKAEEIIKKHCKFFGGSLSDAEVIKLTGLSRNTFYKIKKIKKAQVAESDQSHLLQIRSRNK